MMKWKMFKTADEYIIIYARSFGEALKKARLHDPAYCGGYVVDDDE